MEYEDKELAFLLIDEDRVWRVGSMLAIIEGMTHEDLIYLNERLEKVKQDQQAALDLEKVSRAEKLKELRERADQASINLSIAQLEYQNYKNTYFNDQEF